MDKASAHLCSAKKTFTAVHFSFYGVLLGMLGNYPSKGDLAVGDQIEGQERGAGGLKLAIFF